MIHEPHHDIRLLQIIRNKFFLLFCTVTVLVDLAFPVTFTYDSGYYFSYLKVLDGVLPWSAWDPFRGFVLPFFLKLDTLLLGRSSLALLVPMILLHLFLFLAASWLTLQAIQPTTRAGLHGTIGMVFLFITLDPLIVGWYHVILTEFLASALALAACLVAYALVKRAEGNRKVLPEFLLFSGLAVLAWHLKQPYLGTVIFPLVLGSCLVLMKNRSRTVLMKMAGGNLLVGSVVLISVLAWNALLPAYNGPGLEYNHLSDWFMRAYKQDLDLLKYSPRAFLRNYAWNYLTLSNVYYWEAEKFFNEGEFVIDRDFSLTRARENASMGYRLYERGASNQATISGKYQDEVKPYASRYAAPPLLNTLLKGTTPKSNFLFSSLYLTLPVTFLSLCLLVLKSKSLNNWLVVTFICNGSALLNALEHSFFNLPADRYLFWGYPLLLVCLVTLIELVFKKMLMVWRQSRPTTPGIPHETKCDQTGDGS